MAPDGHVVTKTNLRKVLDPDALAEQQTVRRAAEVEHAELLALLDTLVLPHRDLARADLVHADADKCHQPDGRVIRLQEHDGPRRQRGQVCLGYPQPLYIDGVHTAAVVIVVGWEQRLGEIGPCRYEGADDTTRHGTVPPVV